MKKVIILVSFFLTVNNLYSITTLDSLKIMTNKILEEPEKVINIPINFPQLFNQNYDNKFFHDSIFLRELIVFIRRNYQDYTHRLVLRELKISDYELEPLKGYLETSNFDSSNFYSFVIANGDYGVKFSFIRDSIGYYLIHIAPYPEIIYQINEKFRIILKEPERLLSIQEYFPEFFNNNYIDKRM